MNLSINYYETANQYKQKGEYDLAIENFIRAIKSEPNNIAMYNDLGICYYVTNNYNKAIETYENALKINPEYATAYNNLGIIYFDTQNIEKSIISYKKAIEFNPKYADAYNNLGNLYSSVEKYENAIENYKKAIDLDVNHFSAYNNLGLTLFAIENYNAAIDCYKKALTINPQYSDSYNNLGHVYLEIKEFDLAIANVKKALEFNPENAEAYNNLGLLYYNKKLFDLSVNSYEKAIRLKQNFYAAIFNLSSVYFIQGEFKAGFDLYESRFHANNKEKICLTNFLKPKWNGNSIENKTIYVYYEQGFGDTLMFSRYLLSLNSIGAKVLFKVQKHLESLFEKNNLKAKIISQDTPDDSIEFDEHIPLLSLPRIFKTNLENIPYSSGYLQANPEKAALYKEKYFNNNKFKVGIFWQGNPKGMKERAASLRNFYKISEITNVELYSLQKGYGIGQLDELPDSINIIDLGSGFNDYSDTAAAIANLDLVITIDTSIAHLAAAMNKPTWIVLSYIPEWRWLLDREDTPWYKSVRLFRQKEKNNWEEVFDRVCCELNIKIGHLYAEKNEFNLAIECYNKSLKFDFNQNFIDVYNNLGVCYHNTKQYEFSIEFYKKAIELKHDSVESYCNMGVAYSYLNKDEEAESCYKKAIGLNKEYADAYYNLAILDTKHNRINDSLENYEKSVKLDPNPDRIFNLSMNYLLSGNYKKGLKLYEIRTELEKYKLLNIPTFSNPKWDGRPFKGKTLYIYSEQGLGDSIQFSRYIFQVKHLGGEILFKPQAGLERLFRQSHIPAEIIDNNVKNEDIKFDIHCSIVSLPYLLNSKIDNIPLAKKYLYSDPETFALYKEKYFNNDFLKIGIKWQGNVVGNGNRAASLENFYKLAKLKNIKLYSLQKDFGIEQLKDKPENIDIINLGETFRDFADTAAAVQNLDLIITIDTSVAHLAGAMNKPTWILIPYCPEWRWLLDREDTPWYKSARLFRQKEEGNWDEVLDRVYKELINTKLYNKINVKKENCLQRQDEGLGYSEMKFNKVKIGSETEYNSFNTDNQESVAIVKDLNEIAMAHIDRKEYNLAIETIKKAILIEPENHLLYDRLGMVYTDNKEYHSAIESYKKSLEINPNNASILNNIGFLYYNINQFDLAVECFKKGYSLDPDYVNSLLNLANAYKCKNMIEEALTYYRKLLSLKINYKELYFIEENIDDDIKYLLLKERKSHRIYKIEEYTDIRIAIIYFYEDKFDQDTYNKFASSLNCQIFKNYAVFAVNNNFSDVLKIIETLQLNYICFVEQNDLIPDNALALIAETVSSHQDIDLIYTDEDLLAEDGSFQKPYFKTEYAEFLLLSHNYMNALLCLKLNDKTLEELKKVETIDQAFLYRLVLNLIHKNIKTYRIPEVLYNRHWQNFKKLEQTSTKDIIEEEFKARNYNAAVIDNDNKYYNLVKIYPDKNPKISIIIPFKDKIYLLKNCIESIEKKSTYKNYEILLVNNQSTEPESLEYFNNSKHKKVTADFAFNYAFINNKAVEYAEGEYLLFLNNDIEVITPDWMENLLGLAQLDQAGIVGAKLLYGDNTIQHAGIIKYGNKKILHSNRCRSFNTVGYKNYKNIIREYMAVTGACAMTSKEKFNEIGGFDENLAIELNDIDLNFRFIKAGYINLYNANSVLYHHESISRKGLYRDIVDKEFDYFYKKWEGLINKPDPYYNPNLADFRIDFSIKFY